MEDNQYKSLMLQRIKTLLKSNDELLILNSFYRKNMTLIKSHEYCKKLEHEIIINNNQIELNKQEIEEFKEKIKEFK
jgi:hypothetical protein